MHFLTPSATANKVGLSRSSLDRLVAAGRFPKPIRLSERRLAFDVAEIEGWMAERSAERSEAA